MEKYTLDQLNDILKPFEAVISFYNALRQSKADGYIGSLFKDSNKPVYNFDIVSIDGGISWANIYSPIYKKLPPDVIKLYRSAYIETAKRIYC